MRQPHDASRANPFPPVPKAGCRRCGYAPCASSPTGRRSSRRPRGSGCLTWSKKRATWWARAGSQRWSNGWPRQHRKGLHGCAAASTGALHVPAQLPRRWHLYPPPAGWLLVPRVCRAGHPGAWVPLALHLGRPAEGGPRAAAELGKRRECAGHRGACQRRGWWRVRTLGQQLLLAACCAACDTNWARQAAGRRLACAGPTGVHCAQHIRGVTPAAKRLAPPFPSRSTAASSTCPPQRPSCAATCT